MNFRKYLLRSKNGFKVSLHYHVQLGSQEQRDASDEIIKNVVINVILFIREES